MARMLVRADVVVGEDVAEATVDETVTLQRPATKIADIQARITELECEVLEDQVVITGTLHKQIYYVGPDDRVFHEPEDVLFSAVAVVPGAEPGMHCQVHPTVQNVEFRLVGELPSRELRQRVILVFFVKVTRAEQLNVVLGTTGPLYKMQRVVAEDTAGAVVESTVELDRTAEKVRTIRAVVNEFTATPDENQVIIEGVVHKQIFYIAESNNAEYHQAEDVPFTAVIPIPGVEPDQDVAASIDVSRVSWTLDEDEVNQRVVLSIFVKVTETVQTMLCTNTTGPLVKVKRVVGENTKQSLVENIVCILPPGPPARKIQDITAVITDLDYQIIPGKVLIEGVLHKQIFYVGANDAVHHKGEDVPFSVVIEVPNAEPGMEAQIHPEVEHVGWVLLRGAPQCPGPDDIDPEREEDWVVAMQQGGGLFFAIQQRVVINLFVKVTETVQINVCVEDGPPQG